jgi:hypothetical protein
MGDRIGGGEGARQTRGWCFASHLPIESNDQIAAWQVDKTKIKRRVPDIVVPPAIYSKSSEKVRLGSKSAALPPEIARKNIGMFDLEAWDNSRQ